MRLSFVGERDNHTQNVPLAWSAGPPALYTTTGEVNSGTGMGTPCTLARLEVVNQRGDVARAWVGARLNDRDQVEFELSAGRGKEVRRSLVAHWVRGAGAGERTGESPDAGQLREELARDVSRRVDELAVRAGLTRAAVIRGLVDDLTSLEEG